MARSSTPPRRIKLPLLLLFLLCAVIVLFALNRVMLRPTAQIITDVPGVKLTVSQKALATTDTVVSNQKNVTMLRFEARAEQPSGVRFNRATFSTTQGKPTDAQTYSLWVDTDGDRVVDTLLKTATPTNDSVTFDMDYLLPGAEECETNANCRDGQVCTGCRCTTPGTSLKGQLVTPLYIGSRCTDSDAGRNGSVKGITTNVRMGARTFLAWTDTCLKDWANRPASVPADPMKLLEGYCPSPFSYGQVTYPNMVTCALGCEDGACREALLRSVVLERSDVRVSYAKSFSECATLMSEQGQALHTGSFFCNMNESVTRSVSDIPLVEGQRVKLCRSNGTGCSTLVTVKRVAACGDGIVQTNEKCDDGNLVKGDGCSDTCQIQAEGTRCISPSDCPSSLVCSTKYGVCNHITCPPGVACRNVCSGTCVQPRMSSSSSVAWFRSSSSISNQCDTSQPTQLCPPGYSCLAMCSNGRCFNADHIDCRDGSTPEYSATSCGTAACRGKCARCVGSSSSYSSASSLAFCKDSDGGKIYGVKGHTVGVSPATGEVYEGDDICGDDTNPYAKKGYLVEHFCDGVYHTNEVVKCPNGCSDGACRPEPVVCGNGRIESPEECEVGFVCTGGRICELGTCLCKPSQCGPSSSSSAFSSVSSEQRCAPDGKRVYGSPVFGPTECCSKNAGIKPNSVLAGNECVSTSDGSIGTCIENWWKTCGDGTCDASTEDKCSCLKDCAGGPVCGNGLPDPGEECDGSGCDTGMTCVNCRCLPTGSCGNGFVDTAPSVVFEVHADIASSFTGPQLQLQFNSIGGEDALTGRDLVGLSTNGFCNTNSQSCEMSLTTVNSTLFSLHRQGDLYVTLDSQTIGARQLLAGTLNEPILRVKLHAENEDIDVTALVLTASGGQANSVDSFELWQEGATQSLATSGYCDSEYAAGTFCFSMNSQQLVVPKGSDIKLLVKPRMKSDVNGAVSGDTIAVFIDSVTLPTSVRARGLISSNELLINNGDMIAEGEIFVGRTTAASMNVRVVGNFNTTVLAKIVSIANGGQATGTVPSGADREIGSFAFAASPNANSKNGLNQAELSDLIFTVNATNVALDATGFRIYNKAASMSQREMCLPYSLQGTALTGTVTGVFLVQCSMPSTSAVNSTIDSGGSITLALLGNITNSNTTASSGGSSILQVSLNNFSDPRRTDFGPMSLPTKSFLRWKDRDNASSSVWTWVESPDSAVNSTVFRG
ncbi:MAG: DUF4215 domain-containing protein [Candidatus Peribacter sp.]|nr:DUF4215 domain-containing protein [Candidatus Peribacter sp.]